MNNKLIVEITSCMYEFQKLNNITKQCVTNVQFLYDIIKIKFPNVKVVPVIVLSKNLNETYLVDGHLVLVFENEKNIIIDPSYEIKILKNVHYYYKIKDLINDLDNLFETNYYKKNLLKKNIYTFLKFQKLADKINNNEFVICNKDFYNNQVDYIQKNLNIKFKKAKVNTNLVC
jgi:hypothetical protein